MSTLNATNLKNPNSTSNNIVLAADGSATAPSLVPPGTIQFYAADTAPLGWVKANGAALSRSTYANLFAAIGTTFGVGDGSTTFDLPDMRGEFPRGWDDGRSIDTGRGFGSFQDQESRLYKAISDGTNANNSYRGGPFNGLFAGKDVDSAVNTMDRTFYDFQNGQSGRGLLNTHPRNIALLAIIKY
jgi:phage-related tail fiber protein